MPPKSVVDTPHSKGHAEVFGDVFNGERTRVLRIIIDTGADTSAVDEEVARVLRLRTEPIVEHMY